MYHQVIVIGNKGNQKVSKNVEETFPCKKLKIK